MAHGSLRAAPVVKKQPLTSIHNHVISISFTHFETANMTFNKICTFDMAHDDTTHTHKVTRLHKMIHRCLAR